MTIPDRPRQHYNLTLAILIAVGIAFALQQTMVVPALPAIQRDLHTSSGWVTWLLTGFLLSAAVATPILSKLGDQYGKERLLVISVGVFFLGSVAAVSAPNIWFLLAARIVQGTGGAIFPLSFAIIRDEFPPEKVGAAVGAMSAVFAVGGGLGLVLSGILVDHLSWRWLFVVGGVAVGAAVVLVHRFVPESPVKTPSKVDVKGAALLSAGLLCLLLALTEGESFGWSSLLIVALFGAAAVLLSIWVLVELRVPAPMVNIRMLTQRPVLCANLTGLISGFAMFGSFILVPSFVETPTGLPVRLARLVDYGLGASGTTAGLYLLPGALSGSVSGPLAGWLGRRYGAHRPLALGMLIGAGGAALLAVWHDEPWQLVLGVLVLFFALPFTFAAMAIIVVESVGERETAVATGMNQMMRTVGGVVGGQVGAVLLTADTIGTTSIPAESAFVTAFAISAAVALVGAVIAIFAAPRGPRTSLAALPERAR
jgi:EmrB/QacA subfamily drug resistance transporter